MHVSLVLIGFFPLFDPDYLDLTEFASKILHPLVRALDKNEQVFDSVF